jgi:hypothetical protein
VRFFLPGLSPQIKHLYNTTYAYLYPGSLYFIPIGVANSLNQECGIILFTYTLSCTYTNVKAVPPACSCSMKSPNQLLYGIFVLGRLQRIQHRSRLQFQKGLRSYRTLYLRFSSQGISFSLLAPGTSSASDDRILTRVPSESLSLAIARTSIASLLDCFMSAIAMF